MKLALHLLFTAFACAALLCTISSAASDTETVPQSDKPARTHQRPLDRHAPPKTHTPVTVSVPKPKPPLTAHPATAHSQAGRGVTGATAVRQSISKRPRPVPSTKSSQPASRSDISRHHSPNSATISGASSGLRVANTGALNGTRMSPRP